MNKIDRFSGKYFFLSNFFESEMFFEGIPFLSAESAFQAQKCAISSEKIKFSNLGPSMAKKLGRAIALRKDWESVKCDIMYRVVREKFSQNKHLLSLLKETKDIPLEEGNTWNDKFWGTVNGVGENNLGLILMRVRSELCE